MASLTAKKIHGHTYYYLRECAWVDGRPKIVKQTYLGSADAIAAALGKTPSALQVLPGTPVREFGAAIAVYDLAQRLDVAGLIDRHVSKRGNQGPSVGTMLLLAAINRAVAATSKAQLATWYERTSLPRDLRCLFYDATNFFTFIDTFNARPTLAARGKSKEGRNNLRILGLALLVTGDFQVPLFHCLYPGNHNDPTSFRSVVGELVERYRMLTDGVEDVTLVFDKGNNTEDTLEVVAKTYHVVGSLVPGHHQDLLAIPRKRFDRLDPDRFPNEVSAYRTTKKVFGRSFTVLVTYNENLFDTQTQTIEREVAKRRSKLRDYQRYLSRWQRGKGRGRRPSLASATKAVDKILCARHMKELLPVEITADSKKLPGLRYRFDHAGYHRLQRTLLGKTLLFTDNPHWSDEQIVIAYRGQHHVENAFRQMKDPHYVRFRPAHHWTDQKLRVHAFTCVLALLLCSLLRRELSHQGIAVSVDRMLETLDTIREVQLMLSSGRGRPRVQRTHSQLEPLAAQMFEALDLRRFLPS